MTSKLLDCFRYSVGGDVKYLAAALELVRAERNTLTVSFEDVERYNQQLAVTILEEYYRFVLNINILQLYFCCALSNLCTI